MSLLKQHCLVNGQWIASSNEKTADVTNPSTGEVVATVPQLQESEVEDAVEAAHQAWLSWRDTPAKERSRLLKKWFELLTEFADEIANIMVQEQGKPLSDAKGEMAYANSFIEWFAEEAKRAYGKTLPSPSSHDRLWTLKQPVGVCGIITPWNFPAAMITRKVGPALAAGCSCLIKPAMQTPLTALAMAALAEKAGIPEGVINVVTGDAKMIGQVLTTHDQVRKVSFTGSTQVGRLLMEQSASTIKKLSLELGGNAPFLVFDDADIEAAVDGLIKAKFRNTGQVCIAPNRVYVQSAIYEKFAEQLSKQVSTLTVADGLQE
ncbi:MAG: aldehyde dehydrogenase family protein, partial [Pseudomonadota bacterium]|nr:aldehyde dehydrogenase family protein [Pseudomonadota bacterium]